MEILVWKYITGNENFRVDITSTIGRYKDEAVRY
jgi:hypothetical protein